LAMAGSSSTTRSEPFETRMGWSAGIPMTYSTVSHIGLAG
jgi:hypothetical protein